MLGTLVFSRNCITRADFRLRSPKNRSLLGVNEDFEGERNAEAALLDNFIFSYGKQ